MALQLSIPKTSIGDPSGKPYTLYHISLRLPIRTHETQKRYSDFTSLHSILTTSTGLTPPHSLPAKSWLRTTVSSPALTESRRSALEAYLQAIVTSPDSRWRSSPAWRTFLNLPSESTGGKKGAAAGGDYSEGAITDPGEWLDVHRSVKTQIHSAKELLKKREAVQTGGEQFSVGADAKAALVRAATGVARLETSLGLLAKKTGDDDGGWGGSGKLGEGEVRRRRDMLGQARMEIEGLESSLRSLSGKNAANGSSAGAAAATEGDKEALWKGQSSHRSGRVLGGPSAKETDRTRELDNEGVVGLQKQIMAEQEEDVLEIGKAVSRMKEMGIMINEELVVQNQMLGLMDQDVDRVEGKINVAKKRIAKIS